MSDREIYLVRLLWELLEDLGFSPEAATKNDQEEIRFHLTPLVDLRLLYAPNPPVLVVAKLSFDEKGTFVHARMGRQLRLDTERPAACSLSLRNEILSAMGMVTMARPH